MYKQHVSRSRFPLIHVHEDFLNRLTDGVLPAVVLILTWQMVMLFIRPIRSAFGQPGLMVYTLGLLAVAMFALHHAIQLRFAHTLRAWYGIVGGFMAWSVVEVSAFLGLPAFTSPGGIIIILMVALIFYILWRYTLPIGVKFFGAVFILNWLGHLFMQFQAFFAHESPVFSLSFRATGYAAIAGMVFTLAYILIHSQRRIERVCAAVLIWFFFSLAMYVFGGGLY